MDLRALRHALCEVNDFEIIADSLFLQKTWIEFLADLIDV